MRVSRQALTTVQDGRLIAPLPLCSASRQGARSAQQRTPWTGAEGRCRGLDRPFRGCRRRSWPQTGGGMRNPAAAENMTITAVPTVPSSTSPTSALLTPSGLPLRLKGRYSCSRSELKMSAASGQVPSGCLFRISMNFPRSLIGPGAPSGSMVIEYHPTT